MCVSNLVKDADADKESCTYTDYTLDKTVENALILSSGEDFNIYGEERLSTESEQERLTYIAGLNQSVFANVRDDLSKDEQTTTALEYNDFGETLDIESGFGYNGEGLDESGNIYLRARYYNPRIGQFVQIDSNRGQQNDIESQQRYTYVANNQYKYVDRNGNSFALSLGGIFGGIVTAVKSVSVAAVIGTVGWIAVGVVAVGAVGYGVYRYVNSKPKKQDMDRTPPAPPYIPPKGNTNTKDRSKGKTGDTTTGGYPGTDTVPSSPSAPTLRLPEPCPDNFGWDQLPKNVIAAIGMLGMGAWVNELLPKLKFSRRYKKNQTHHIIAKNAWSACGSVKHDFYLDDARTVVESHFGDVDNLHNFAYINNGLHRRIHTKLYYQSINWNFPLSLQDKTPSNKGIVRARLLNYKIALEGLSYLSI